MCAAAFAMQVTGCSHPAENSGKDGEVGEADRPAHTASALAPSSASTSSRNGRAEKEGPEEAGSTEGAGAAGAGCACSHRASSLAAMPLNDWQSQQLLHLVSQASVTVQ